MVEELCEIQTCLQHRESLYNVFNWRLRKGEIKQWQCLWEHVILGKLLARLVAGWGGWGLLVRVGNKDIVPAHLISSPGPPNQIERGTGINGRCWDEGMNSQTLWKGFPALVFIYVQSITARTARVSGQTAGTDYDCDFPESYISICAHLYMHFLKTWSVCFIRFSEGLKTPPKLQNHWLRAIWTYNPTSFQARTHLFLPFPSF